MDIVKWGNSAAVRIPAPLLAQLDMRIGDSFQVEISNGALTLRPAKPKTDQRHDLAIEAVKYALGVNDGMAFLDCWLRGDMNAIAKGWPDTPRKLL